MTRLFSLQPSRCSSTLDQLTPKSSITRKHLLLTKQNIQGFSLIELMVAVGIMGGMTTLAVPQYGKYKLKAAQTEVKATLANIHGAQELHLVDQNKYATNLAGVGLDKSVPAKKTSNAAGDFTAEGSGQNFVYGSQLVGSNGVGANANGDFCTSNDGNDCAAAKADGVEYRIVATAIRKLASCAVASKLEIWCLNNNKLITNKTNSDAFSGGSAKKRCSEQVENTSTTC